jgi:hypothetical protein
MHERMIVQRDASGCRDVIVTETTQQSDDGWAAALREMRVTFAAGGGGGGVADPLRVGTLLDPGTLEPWQGAAQIRLSDGYHSVGVGAGGDPFVSGASSRLVALAAFPPEGGTTSSQVQLSFDLFTVDLVPETATIRIRIQGVSDYSQDAESHVFTLGGERILDMQRDAGTEECRIGFLGAAPVARPSIAAGEGTEIQLESVIEALVALGLVSDDRFP